MAVAEREPSTAGEYTSPVCRFSADKRRLGSRRDLFRPPNQVPSQEADIGGAGPFGPTPPPARQIIEA